MKYDVIIIGGGASGLFLASKLKVNKGLIIESTNTPGNKLLITGAGSCNITNARDIKEFPKMYGDSGNKIRKMLYRYNNRDLMEYIESLNIPLIIREDNKVFPLSMKSKDILDKLMDKAIKNGFELITGSNVIDTQEGEVVTLKGTYLTNNIVIATGGKSYPQTGSDGKLLDVLKDKGIDIVDQIPALTPIFVQNYMYRKVSGISFRNISVRVDNNETYGDVLLTHKGFSGPAVLRLSEYAKPGGKINISYIDKNTGVPKKDGISKTLINFISEKYYLPKKFLFETTEYLKIDGNKRTSNLSNNDFKRIIDYLKNAEYSISGTGGFKSAMVTAGGISLDEIDLKTMKLKKYNNIYAIGEVLDINGDTGGYNLQFSYSSAMIAANSIDNDWTI